MRLRLGEDEDKDDGAERLSGAHPVSLATQVGESAGGMTPTGGDARAREGQLRACSWGCGHPPWRELVA
ncbi:MAG: hypothetical protein M3198_01605 [Actinomycetota bacterium]|nr:hypothetical protein [Actinomycetota bacterium]